MEITTATPAARAAHGDTAGDGFFAYHGWLAPGVRLFRTLRFPAKAALIACAFSVPLLALLGFLSQQAWQQISAARLEREGLHYIAPVLDLMRAVERERLARIEAQAGAPGRIVEAAAAVAAAHARYGADLGDAAAYEAHERALATLKAVPPDAGSKQVLGAYDDFLAKAGHLVLKIADGSTLSLDPAADTYHLISFTLLRGAAMSQNLAQMHALVMQAQHHPDTRMRDELLALMGAQKVLLRDMDNDYAEAVKADPTLAREFDPRSALGALRELDSLLQAWTAGKPVTTEALAQAADAALQAYGALHARAVTLLGEQLDERIADIETVLAWQLGASCFCVILAAYFLIAFYRVMMGGLRTVGSHLEHITAGNLTTAPEPWGRDEAASLMLTMGGMQKSLRRVVSEVLESSGRIASASREIDAAANGLSARTEQSATNLEEAAASMEQLAQTVAGNLAAVEQASAIVGENARAAARGQEVVDQLLATMAGMQAASREIAGIVGVIDSIAFQTNLLALNAAVEAARAGESGRGFAVVAQEVRQLAGRSAESAKHIKRLIESTVVQVEGGVAVAHEAGQAIGTVRDSAQEVDSLIGKLAGAAREQAIGVEQVRRMVVEIDSVTQENAAMVEEASAAAASLSDDAARMAQTARFFRLA